MLRRFIFVLALSCLTLYLGVQAVKKKHKQEPHKAVKQMSIGKRKGHQVKRVKRTQAKKGKKAGKKKSKKKKSGKKKSGSGGVVKNTYSYSAGDNGFKYCRTIDMEPEVTVCVGGDIGSRPPAKKYVATQVVGTLDGLISAYRSKVKALKKQGRFKFALADEESSEAVCSLEEPGYFATTEETYSEESEASTLVEEVVMGFAAPAPITSAGSLYCDEDSDNIEDSMPCEDYVTNWYGEDYEMCAEWAYDGAVAPNEDGLVCNLYCDEDSDSMEDGVPCENYMNYWYGGFDGDYCAAVGYSAGTGPDDYDLTCNPYCDEDSNGIEDTYPCETYVAEWYGEDASGCARWQYDGAAVPNEDGLSCSLYCDSMAPIGVEDPQPCSTYLDYWYGDSSSCVNWAYNSGTGPEDYDLQCI